MANISEMKSGFDIEFLMSEDYIRYFLLSNFETGTIPCLISGDDGYDIIIHPPADLPEKRLYDPHPEYVMHPYIDINLDYAINEGSFDVQIAHDTNKIDLILNLIVSTVNRERYSAGLPASSAQVPMEIHLRFRIESETDMNGFQNNVRLNIEAYDIGGQAVDIYTALVDPDTGERFEKSFLLNNIRRQVNRRVPLDFIGPDAGIEKIETKKFGADENHPAAFGIYMNFKLRNGRGSGDYLQRHFLESVTLRAENFLENGQNFAFGFKGTLYEKLGNDIYYRLFPDDGSFYLNPPLIIEGKESGEIYSLRFEPDYVMTSHGETFPTNRFKFIVDGKYTVIERGIDQAFTLKIFLIPVFDDNNFVTWDIDFDIDLETNDLIPLIAYAVAMMITGNIVTGSLLFFLMKNVIEKIAEEKVASFVDSEMGDVSVFNTFPNKFVVERRRWDLFYECEHQLLTGISQLEIIHDGFVMAGEEVFLGREIKLLPHVVPRNEVRGEGGMINSLQYRIKDYFTIPEADLTNIFSATDRMPVQRYLPAEGTEKRLAELSFEQIEERMAVKRILSKIPYDPVKVHIREGQIYQLMLLSRIEQLDIPADFKRDNRNRVRAEIRNRRTEEIREEAVAQLMTELGREPAADEVDERFESLLEKAVENELGYQAIIEKERQMRFDMEPDEFADLIRRKIISLPGYMIQTRRRDEGGVTTFLRDDFPYFGGDDKNLIDLPRYKSEIIVR